jgi:5-methylcytosine-specific restriction protein B
MGIPSSTVADSFRAVLAGVEQFRQIILYGPPGTGKTLLAQRLALALLGDSHFGPTPTGPLNAAELHQFEDLQKEGQLALTVMHPALSYEQFVIGVSGSQPVQRASAEKVVRAFKCVHCTRVNKVRMPAGGPAAASQKLERGIFWRMCKHADKAPAVLIADEINRANLARLFGDLLYALEYRDRPVALPFEYREGSDGKKTRNFKVPKNLYLIGTMNSADRSLPPLDVVVKRRFGLFQVEPDPEVVKAFWQNRDPKLGRQLVTLMKRMNDALARKDPEGDMRVGHAYFLADQELRDPAELRKQVARKWEHQVHQLLVEYDRVLGMGADFFKRFPKRFE